MGTIKLGKKSVSEIAEEKVENVVEEELSVTAKKAVTASRVRTDLREGILKNPSILFEDKSLRTTHSKTYRRNDGSAHQVITGYPVHYAADGETELQEIDNTLIDAGDRFETKTGKYRFSIAKSAAQEGTLKMSGEGVSIAWDYQPEKTSEAKLRKIALDEAQEVSEKPLSGVVYEDAADSTDIEYSIAGSSVKENIIVRSRREEYRYSFLLSLSGVTPRLSEDGTRIEFYKEAGDGTEPFAEIPAPYMYDNAGEKSDEVYYELEETENGYSFTVIADAAWINAENRAFPVIIDPQIALSDQAYFTVTSEKRSKTVDGTLTVWGNWGTYTPAEIAVSSENPSKRCTVKVPYSKLSFLNYPISSATLTLYKQSGTGTKVNVNGSTHYVVNDSVTIDITSAIKGGIDYEGLLTYKDGALTFWQDGVYAPVLKISYLLNEGIRQTFKTVQLAGNASAEIEVYTGESVVTFEDVTENDTPLGVGIYHVHKLSDENYHCGNHFRLNLHERLVGSVSESYDQSYTYTDERGFLHGFTNIFYYLNASNKKVYVEKSSVTVDLDGSMTYDGHDVYMEQLATSGLKLVTQVDGLNDSEYLEQRMDEVKQLEGQIQSYRSTLEQFVVCEEYGFDPIWGGRAQRWSGKIFDTVMENPYELFIKAANGEYFVMTESDRLNIVSLQRQIDSLNLQIQSYDLQLEALSDSKVSLQHQIDSYKYAIKKDGDSKDVNNALISDCNAQIDALDSQKDMYNLFKSNLSAQISSLENQHEAIIEKHGDYLRQVTDYYKEYVNLVYQLKQYKKQVPVSYITNGSVYKGFNEDGQLVAIYDGYENTISIIYDEEDKITTIYDGEDEQITLSYNANGLLTSMTDTRGRRTVYEYDASGNLIKITRANGKETALAYDSTGNIVTVTAEGEKSALTYDGGLASVKYYSTVQSIAHGKTVAATADMLLSSVSVQYTGSRTVMTDQDGNKLYYIFSGEGALGEYYEETNGVVTKAEKYSYTAYSSETKESVKATLLNRKSYSSFTYATGEKSVTTLDQFNNPTKTVISGQVVAKNTTATTTTVYAYDEEHRCVKETSTVKLTGDATDSYTSVTTYAYNASGSLVRKESYIAGEEFTTGITIEETVYDEKGNQIKSFTYNSLDTSSKFYTESEYAENGQVTAEKDETGEVSAEYEYIEGTTVVRAVKYPNGGRFAYGHDIDDTVTAITQSTAEGEENSTQLCYTCGEVTEVVSGNNAVRYAYDGKRRKTAIDLNGREHYETYTYSEGAKEDSVTAVNAKGETFTTVTDKKGQVLRALYGEAVQVSYTYDADGNVLTETDGVTGEIVANTYNTLGKLTAYARGEYTESYAYDGYGNVTEYAQGARTYMYAYKNNAARDLASVSVEGFTVTPETDISGRNKGKEITGASGRIAGEYLYYRKVGDHATNMPSAVYFGGKINGKYAISDNVKYEYDKLGNICKIFENGALAVRYEYDGINRLTREDNKKLGITVLYAYDNCGNIISMRRTSFTLKTNVEECEFEETLYSYDGDRLLSFGNEVCVYDEIGNPTTYRGKQVSWTKGRQMTAFDGNTFTYDGRGRRISKNGITYTYDGSGRLIASSDGLEYLYDNAGLFAVKRGETTYLYRKDAQGNIVALLDGEGNVVVKYVYDAWGNHAVLDGNGNDIADENHIGNLNPFRYRGYFYDTETGLYYLQTRYYDPEIGRFITIDGIEYIDPETINGLNLYAYALNNPVNYCDPSGHFVISAIIMGFIIGAAVGAVIGGTVAGVTAYNNGARGWELFGWTTLGIVGGGMLGAAIGAGIAAALPTISSFLSSTFILGNFINAAGELVAVTVTGAQIAAAGLAALAGMGIMFSSTNRPGDNRKQNEQYREAMRRLGYSKEDWQWRYGHDHLPNESLGFKDLLKFLEDLFSKFK